MIFARELSGIFASLARPAKINHKILVLFHQRLLSATPRYIHDVQYGSILSLRFPRFDFQHGKYSFKLQAGQETIQGFEAKVVRNF